MIADIPPWLIDRASRRRRTTRATSGAHRLLFRFGQWTRRHFCPGPCTDVPADPHQP